jgi:hypothetical protein
MTKESGNPNRPKKQQNSCRNKLSTASSRHATQGHNITDKPGRVSVYVSLQKRGRFLVSQVVILYCRPLMSCGNQQCYGGIDVRWML